ncbi:MAG: hypothetical protein WD989_00125 [Candidatus Paceibacterota bacterium]
MTKDELKKLYEDLDQEEKNLRAQLDEVATKNPTVKNDFDVKVPDYGDEDDDNTMESTDLERDLNLSRMLEIKLREVIKTKEEIKNGTTEFLGRLKHDQETTPKNSKKAE